MSDKKPIEIRHSRPAFKATTKSLVESIEMDDKDVHIVSEPPHRIVSRHYNTPDGRPVTELFPTEGQPSEGSIDPKPMLLPDVPRWSKLDDAPTGPEDSPGNVCDVLNETEWMILDVLIDPPEIRGTRPEKMTQETIGDCIRNRFGEGYGDVTASFKTTCSGLVKRGLIASGGRGRGSKGYSLTSEGKRLHKINAEKWSEKIGTETDQNRRYLRDVTTSHFLEVFLWTYTT